MGAAPAFEETLPEEDLDAVEVAVLALYAGVRRQVIAALRKQQTGVALVAAAGDKPSNPDVMDEAVFLQLSTEMIDALSDVLLDAAAGAKIAIGWDITDASLDAIVREHLAEIENFAPRLRKSVADWIAEGLRTGMSIDDMVEALPDKSPLSTKAARMVARTESVAASNASSTRAWQEAGIGGFRRWLSTNDARTRDDHWDADGQTVPMDQPFYVGGEAARYPGDPRLSPAQRCNCRCSSMYVTEGGDVRTIPVTRGELQQVAKSRGLKTTGTNGALRRRLVDNLPDAPARSAALDGLGKKDLLERASAAGIVGRSKMTKSELVEALRSKQAFSTMAFPVKHSAKNGRFIGKDDGPGGLTSSAEMEKAYADWTDTMQRGDEADVGDLHDEIASYCDEGFRTINSDLRAGSDLSHARAQRVDVALEMAGPTTQPIQARRWVDGDVAAQMKEGTEFTERGFMSTTLNPKMGGEIDVGAGGPIPVHITIPAGMRGAYVAKISPSDRELEFLVGQGVRLRITKANAGGLMAEVIDQAPTLGRRGLSMAAVSAAAVGEKFLWDDLELTQPGELATFARERRANGTYAPKGQGVPSIAGWTKTGPQGGSNPGGEYTAPDGTRHYVKGSESPQHAQNEALAAELYTMAGVTVPEVQVVDLADQFGDRKIGVASKMVDGKRNLPERHKDPAYADAIGKDFAVDAWLANWDTTGLGKDNIIEVGGKPHRVDVGGSLLYRAQGAPKGSAFGPKVTEVDTLRNPRMNKDAADVFGRRTPGPSDPVFMDGARRVAALSPGSIGAAVRGKITDPGVAKSLTDTLLARQADIARMAGIKVALSMDHGPWTATFLRAAPATARGVAGRLSPGELAATKRLARAKTRNVPKPSDEHVAAGLRDAAAYRTRKVEGKTSRAGGDRRGSNEARRKRSEELLAEFTMPSGKCGCSHCGIELKATRKSPGRQAPLSQDKIITGKQGGRYGLENLVPACEPCNNTTAGKAPFGMPRWGDPARNARRVATQIGVPYDKLDDFTTYAVGRWSPHPPSSASPSPTARFESKAGPPPSSTAGTPRTTPTKTRWWKGRSRSGGSSRWGTGSFWSRGSSSTPAASSSSLSADAGPLQAFPVKHSGQTGKFLPKGTSEPGDWTGKHFPAGDGPNPFIPYGATTDGLPLNAWGKAKKGSKPGDQGAPKSGKLAGTGTTKSKAAAQPPGPPPKIQHQGVKAPSESPNHFEMGKAAQPWLEGLPIGERKAIRTYTGNGSAGMNALLRKGSVKNEKAAPGIHGRNVRMDRALAKAPPITEPILVHRGLHSTYAENLSKLPVGGKYTDHGFGSTSLTDRSAGTKTITRITVPPGTRGGYVATISQHGSEREFILGHGTTFKVTGKSVIEKPIMKYDIPSGKYVPYLDKAGKPRTSRSTVLDVLVIAQEPTL